MKDITITSRLEREPVTTLIERKKERKEGRKKERKKKKLGVTSRVRTRFFRDLSVAGYVERNRGTRGCITTRFDTKII